MLQDLIHRVGQNIRRFEERGERPTEEATKHALVLPFISNVLGADYHDPDEVIPEYIADIGQRKGEKVDYAICREGEPIILIECKALHVSLDDDAVVQLQRYVGSLPDVSLGVLTDGQQYRFFADLDAINILDKVPFLSIDLLDLTPESEERLKSFRLDSLDVERVKESGRCWKAVDVLVRALEKEWKEPSTGYVTHFGRLLYSDTLTAANKRQCAGYLKEAHRLFLDRQTESPDRNSLNRTDMVTNEESGPDSGEQPPEGWQPLTETTTVSGPPRYVWFPDGSTTNVGSWPDLLTAVAQKLDYEGHFLPSNIPNELRNFIYVPSPKQNLKRPLKLSNGLMTNLYLSPIDCLRRSIRFLKECKYNPANVYVK